MCNRSLALVLTGWCLVALFVGETQLLAIVPPSAIPVAALTLTSLITAGYFAVSCFREHVDSIPLRALVALHLTRFVGAYFLYLNSTGELPGDFAIKAGWGDILIAVLALPLIIFPTLLHRRGVVLTWNVLGLADILFVVGNAARLVTAEPFSMAPFMKLPLSFLPTFLVPLIIASHIVVFYRLFRQQTPSERQREAPIATTLPLLPQR